MLWSIADLRMRRIRSYISLTSIFNACAIAWPVDGTSYGLTDDGVLQVPRCAGLEGLRFFADERGNRDQRLVKQAGEW
jgi:hypothetical protein